MNQKVYIPPRMLVLGETYRYGADLLHDYKKYYNLYVMSEIEQLFNTMALEVQPRNVEVHFQTPSDLFSGTEERLQAIFFQRAERLGFQLFPKDACVRLSAVFPDQKRLDGKYYIATRPHRLKSGKEIIFYLAVLNGVHWLRYEESTYDTVLKQHAKFLFCRPVTI